jgi:3-methyladenine DNA glycosylase AlkD
MCTVPAPTPAELAETLLAELRAQAVPANLEGMARYGIVTTHALGVPMPVVRALARDARRRLGRDKPAWHELAALLWASGVHEARIMASVVDVAALVDEVQMERWALEIDSWDVCDGLTNNLFRATPFAWQKAAEWPGRAEEFVKRAGFVLGASLAVHDKQADDAEFLPLLTLAEREATDERNMVKKAVNWQIRQIGKRSAVLNGAAIATCERLLAGHPDSRSARWTARDALRELRSDAVRARLGLG